jgi:hypothetical protein
VYTKNQLWHPLDHTKKQDFKLQPGKKRKDPVSLMTKLDEVYRWVGDVCALQLRVWCG